MARTIRELALSVLLAAALFLGIDNLTARSVVEGPSMEPTLRKGQVLLISRVGISGITRLAYAATHPDEPADISGWVPPRGSLCTFVHPSDPDRVLVKRVIGLPGETISVDHGVVFVDGRPLDEPYLVNRDTRVMPAVRVPEDSIYVMGDNRPSSADSRAFGPVRRDQLLGVAVLRYWPLSDFGPLTDDWWPFRGD